PAYVEHHLTALRELASVLEQVVENLPKSHRIANRPGGHVGRQSRRHVEIPAPPAERGVARRILDQLHEVELNLVELNPSGHGLRQVEEVAHQAQKLPPAAPERVGIP